MKRLFLLMLLLFPVMLFSQEIIGKWHAKGSPSEEKQVIEYKEDGTIDMYDATNQQNKTLRTVNLTYKVFSENGIDYLEITMHKQGQIVYVEKVKYKIEKGILYLPSFGESNGVEKVTDYKDEYIRLK